MKKSLPYIITICLIVIVVLMLLRNKQEIDAQIAFAEQKVEAFPVKVEEVKLGTLDTKLEVSGILAPVHELMLMAETQGRVIAIYKKEGNWVNKGDMIAKVNDELMRAELMVTEANYKKAQKDLERAKTLNDGGAITQQQLEGLQLNEKAAHAKYITSKKRLSDTAIKAPISGYINKLFLKEGGMIGAGVPACELVNIRSLKMSLKVDENDVVKISREQIVEVKVGFLKDKMLKGEVVSIGTKADYALQYGIEIIISENPDERLKAGMVATALFNFPDEEEGPVISRKALVGSARDPKVYVVEGDKAILRTIKISESNEDLVKISDGLSEGDRLVSVGQFNLRNQVEVKVIE
ncbi:MAG: efflux RND transporter periplasmic adaptor subunit [Cyclobacteriaceae bacterium]|nr:efflux RND transporter periplasmic adaptor subunit [Cyclobacteriaceae bacterium]